MSLESLTSRNDYLGTSALHVYAYSFYILLNSHLRVTVQDTTGNETTLTLTTDYTVSGVGAASGGNVTLVNASQAWLTSGELTTGYTLTIRRVLPLTQIDDIRNQETFYPETHEDAFDKAIMIDQQQQDELERSIQLPETVDPADFDTDLPASIVGSVSKILATNTTGDAFELLEVSDVAAMGAEGDHNVIDAQAATALTGETIVAANYTSAVYNYEIIRGTTVFSTGTFSLHYRNGAWYICQGEERREDAAPEHGVTFSVTGTTTAQLKAALDAGAGNGTIKLKRHLFDA